MRRVHCRLRGNKIDTANTGDLCRLKGKMNMATKEELAQLSLCVYDVKGLAINRPALPSSDWEELEYHPDDRTGFSYGVFKNTRNTTTGEVVIAYTGSNEKLVVDFFGTNIPAGVGWTSLQVKSAALAYQQALQKYGSDASGSNITFTGHSLGGGLASVMAVWFNRPATTFDKAPFQLTASSDEQLTNTKAYLAGKGFVNAVMDNAVTDFTSRESRVIHYYTQGNRGQIPIIMMQNRT